MQDRKEMNLHQKILKIADMAGVLRKNREGFGYKYTTEDEIQAKITAGMQKYGVLLMPSLVPGSLEVIQYHYDKLKTKRIKNNGKEETVEYTVPVNELIVKSEVEYIWSNTDNPEEKLVRRWAYIGQMDDAAQAFGAGATYGNRYYLLKALQLATTEDDPDSYRSKQQAAERYEEEKAAMMLKAAIAEISSMGTALIKSGATPDQLHKVIAKYNNGNENLNSIQSLDICDTIKNEFEQLKLSLQNKKKQEKK